MSLVVKSIFVLENSFMGMGIGAAMTGLRPIVEGMNMGFLLLAFNQISNNCGMLHYTSGGQYKVPMVVRGPGGVGKQLGAEHSQRLESYFQSIPGVQLVACSTVQNSKALLKSAIRSDNPVIFFEHVLLYNLKGETKDGYLQPLERAELAKEGTDLTILTYSRMRYSVLQACQELEKKNIHPEVHPKNKSRHFERVFFLGRRFDQFEAFRYGDDFSQRSENTQSFDRGGMHENGRHWSFVVCRDFGEFVRRVGSSSHAIEFSRRPDIVRLRTRSGNDRPARRYHSRGRKHSRNGRPRLKLRLPNQTASCF